MKWRCGDSGVEGSEVEVEVSKSVVWKWNQAFGWSEIDSEGCMMWDDWVRSAR